MSEPGDKNNSRRGVNGDTGTTREAIDFAANREHSSAAREGRKSPGFEKVREQYRQAVVEKERQKK